MNLEGYYQAALKRSEDLANQEELITQAEERVTQAIGSVLPVVVGTVSHLRQQTPRGGTASSFSPESQTIARINITQPLFRGFREFATLKQQKALVGASRANKAQASILLFQDVVQNYYQILSLSQDLLNLQHEINLNQKRLLELHSFLNVGRARESEVLTLDSNIASLEAQKESLNGQLESAKDIFTFMSGLPQDTPILDSEELPNQNEEIENYLSQIELRPDIQSLVKSVAASNEGINIAYGGHFPSLDLLGNYYLTRAGLLSNVNWDIQFALTIPILQGGITQSQVRQASSILRQSQIALTKARRLAQEQIHSFFHLFQSDYAQVLKLKKALKLSEKNYKSEQRDYRLGLVTNLEVLQSLTAYEETQRQLSRAKFQLKSDFLKLQAVSAIRPKAKKDNDL